MDFDRQVTKFICYLIKLVFKVLNVVALFKNPKSRKLEQLKGAKPDGSAFDLLTNFQVHLFDGRCPAYVKPVWHLNLLVVLNVWRGS